MAEKTLAYTLLEKFNSDRENIERYIALADLCPLPAFIIGHDNSTVLYVNPAYRSLTGRSLDELQDGRWIDLVIHPDDRAAVAAVWKHFTETSDIRPHHHRYIDREGQVTDAITLLERIEGNGFVGFIMPQCGIQTCPMLRVAKLASPAGILPG